MFKLFSQCLKQVAGNGCFSCQLLSVQRCRLQEKVAVTVLIGCKCFLMIQIPFFCLLPLGRQKGQRLLQPCRAVGRHIGFEVVNGKYRDLPCYGRIRQFNTNLNQPGLFVEVGDELVAQALQKIIFARG